MKPSDYIKEGWTQDTFARDEQGHAVNYDDPKAVSWCLMGAIYVSKVEVDHPRFGHRLSALMSKNLSPLMYWNDHLKNPKRVIEVLEQVEQELGIE